MCQKGEESRVGRGDSHSHSFLDWKVGFVYDKNVYK